MSLIEFRNLNLVISYIYRYSISLDSIDNLKPVISSALQPVGSDPITDLGVSHAVAVAGYVFRGKGGGRGLI